MQQAYDTVDCHNANYTTLRMHAGCCFFMGGHTCRAVIHTLYTLHSRAPEGRIIWDTLWSFVALSSQCHRKDEISSEDGYTHVINRAGDNRSSDKLIFLY